MPNLSQQIKQAQEEFWGKFVCKNSALPTGYWWISMPGLPEATPEAVQAFLASQLTALAHSFAEAVRMEKRELDIENSPESLSWLGNKIGYNQAIDTLNTRIANFLTGRESEGE